MLSTRVRRALQPLWNAFDDVAAVFLPGCVLAVSGGPDSRALLEAFATWDQRPPTVVVATVDHGRRPGSSAEAHAVGLCAHRLGLEHRIVLVTPVAGDEQSLRRARYAALHEVARERGIAAIATAHHRGDVAEGLLLHLAGRGGGRGGRAPHVVEHRQGRRLVRPFIALPKSHLLDALAALDIQDVVVDEDDAAGLNARALVRQRLLAPLQEHRADVEAALARHARHRAEDDDVIEALIPKDDVVDASLAPALLRRWLLRQVGRVVTDPRTAPAAIDDVLRLCALGRAGRVDLRGSRAEIWHQRERGLVVAVVVGAGQSDRR